MEELTRQELIRRLQSSGRQTLSKAQMDELEPHPRRRLVNCLSYKNLYNPLTALAQNRPV